MEALEGGDSMQISPEYPFHFVGVMMMVISRPVVVIWAWGFWETVDEVLIEWAQLLDGVGLAVGVPVLAAVEAADGHFFWRKITTSEIECLFGGQTFSLS